MRARIGGLRRRAAVAALALIGSTLLAGQALAAPPLLKALTSTDAAAYAAVLYIPMPHMEAVLITSNLFYLIYCGVVIWGFSARSLPRLAAIFAVFALVFFGLAVIHG